VYYCIHVPATFAVYTAARR